MTQVKKTRSTLGDDTRRQPGSTMPPYDEPVSSSSSSVSSRDAILDAAQALISDQGYDGMAISDLSAACGLPASSIYYHFGNKLGVLAALLERTFNQMHRSYPSPVTFDDHPPMERFEKWFTAACRSLDERPDYLRLLLAVSIGSHAADETVSALVRRIRDFAHDSWVDALTPILAPVKSAKDKALVNELAVIGRAMTDGLSVTVTFDGGKYSSHVPAFVALVRGLAEQRRQDRA